MARPVENTDFVPREMSEDIKYRFGSHRAFMRIAGPWLDDWSEASIRNALSGRPTTADLARAITSSYTDLVAEPEAFIKEYDELHRAVEKEVRAQHRAGERDDATVNMTDMQLAGIDEGKLYAVLRSLAANMQIPGFEIKVLDPETMEFRGSKRPWL